MDEQHPSEDLVGSIHGRRPPQIDTKGKGPASSSTDESDSPRSLASSTSSTPIPRRKRTRRKVELSSKAIIDRISNLRRVLKELWKTYKGYKNESLRKTASFDEKDRMLPKKDTSGTVTLPGVGSTPMTIAYAAYAELELLDTLARSLNHENFRCDVVVCNDWAKKIKGRTRYTHLEDTVDDMYNRYDSTHRRIKARKTSGILTPLDDARPTYISKLGLSYTPILSSTPLLSHSDTLLLFVRTKSTAGTPRLERSDTHAAGLGGESSLAMVLIERANDENSLGRISLKSQSYFFKDPENPTKYRVYIAQSDSGEISLRRYDIETDSFSTISYSLLGSGIRVTGQHIKTLEFAQTIMGDLIDEAFIKMEEKAEERCKKEEELDIENHASAAGEDSDDENDEESDHEKNDDEISDTAEDTGLSDNDLADDEEEEEEEDTDESAQHTEGTGGSAGVVTDTTIQDRRRILPGGMFRMPFVVFGQTTSPRPIHEKTPLIKGKESKQKKRRECRCSVM